MQLMEMPRETLSSTTLEALQMEEAPHWSLFTGLPQLLRVVHFEKSPHGLSGFPLPGILSDSSSFLYFFLDNISSSTPNLGSTSSKEPSLIFTGQAGQVYLLQIPLTTYTSRLQDLSHYSGSQQTIPGEHMGLKFPGLIPKSIRFSRTGMRSRSGSCNKYPRCFT